MEKTKRIVCIGSCLSASILSHLLTLDLGYTAAEPIDHSRSDLLADWLAGHVIPPATGLAEEIVHANSDHASLRKNIRRINNQNLEALTGLIANIREADFILLDNNYDLSAKLFEGKHSGQSYKFSNLVVADEESRLKAGPLLSLESLPAVYEKLKNALLALNPRLRIFLIQYPIGNFAVHNPGRAERSRWFSEHIRPDGMTLFPLVEIPESQRSDKGAFYFAEEVYEDYAGALLRLFKGETPTWMGQQTISFSDLAARTAPGKPGSHVQPNPYSNLPPHHFWRTGVAERYALALEDVYRKKFSITSTDRIATCGSCFAQHVGRRLRRSGYSLLDVEPAPEGLPKTVHTERGYGIFSGRYGNIYTSRQLLQLFDEAFSERPIDEVWESKGRFFDPFRPNIDPDGHASREDVLEARRMHLAAVRRMFESTDVLIFTMGLTECWINSRTGVVYPTCPGVTVGQYDAAIHTFHNLGFDEIMSDMRSVLGKMKSINPGFRLLLTVSPVPLTATAANRHVLVATTYSKSVLRAVAGALADRHAEIDYFPSYEIVTSPASRGLFYGSNLRSVHNEGVDHVMSHFFREHRLQDGQARPAEIEENDDLCDEAFLELARKTRTH